MSILFVDPATPKPYDTSSLDRPGLGGTEATMIRIANALGNTTVMQHNRRLATCETRVEYVPPHWAPATTASAIVVLRCVHTALAFRQRYRSVPIYVWLHDICTKREALKMQELKDKGIDIICVSQYHAHQVRDCVKTYNPELIQMPDVRVIHNPISDTLGPDATPRNPNKLVFFSSPHKGLAYALDTFNALHSSHPELELWVSNPGYLPTPPVAEPGVHMLGSLSHADALQHVREASFVWYPNWVFPETFGLVFAEANAVGTPVLTHALGAAREVMENAAQFVDCKDRVKLIDKAEAWLRGDRPSVCANPKLRLSNIVKEWGKI